jgi:hypothetical protein
MFIVVCVKCNLWFSDHQFEGMVQLYYVLLQTQYNCIGNTQNAWIICQWQCLGKNTEVLMLFMVETKGKCSRRLWADRSSVDRSFVTPWALFVRNLFLHCKHLTSIILKAYATSKGAGLLEANGMMAEPGLVDSPLLYIGHTALIVQLFLAAETWLWLHNISACLIWLAPCDFFLFPRLKLQLRGCCLQLVPEIQEELLTILHTIPKQFQQSFQKLQKCWTHWINSERDYFEGDSNDRKQT